MLPSTFGITPKRSLATVYALIAPKNYIQNIIVMGEKRRNNLFDFGSQFITENPPDICLRKNA